METFALIKEYRTDAEIFHWVYFCQIKGGQAVSGSLQYFQLKDFWATEGEVERVSFLLVMRIT